MPLLSSSNISTYSIPPTTSQLFNSSFCEDQGYQWQLGPTTDWFPASLSSSCLSSILQRCSSYIADHPTTSYDPLFSRPCCGNECLFWAQTAKVIYWPTPALQPGVTSIVDGNGFTLSVSGTWFGTYPLSQTIAFHPRLTLPSRIWRQKMLAAIKARPLI